MKLWIARDKNGRLFLHDESPYSIQGYWFNNLEEYTRLNDAWFPSVTFENSPQQVELKLINDEN